MDFNTCRSHDMRAFSLAPRESARLSVMKSCDSDEGLLVACWTNRNLFRPTRDAYRSRTGGLLKARARIRRQIPSQYSSIGRTRADSHRMKEAYASLFKRHDARAVGASVYFLKAPRLKFTCQ